MGREDSDCLAGAYLYETLYQCSVFRIPSEWHCQVYREYLGRAYTVRGPRLFDGLSPAVLTIRVVSVRFMTPFDICGMIRFAQRFYSRTINFDSTRTVHGKDIRSRGSTSGLVVAGSATATPVVTFESSRV